MGAGQKGSLRCIADTSIRAQSPKQVLETNVSAAPGSARRVKTLEITDICLRYDLERLRTLQQYTHASLYPSWCLSCRIHLDPDQPFCAACERRIHPICSPLRQCCGVPFFTQTGRNHLCRRCLKTRPVFRQAGASASYQTGIDTPLPLRNALLRFKYARDLRARKCLARLSAAHFSLSHQDFDAILPFPLHIDRLRRRCLNQSLLLAPAIGKRWMLPVDPLLLIQTPPTPPQTQLDKESRRANVRKTLQVDTPTQVQGKRLLLVDDLYSSGATVEECARTLYQSGARVVDVFTLTRAVDL